MYTMISGRFEYSCILFNNFFILAVYFCKEFCFKIVKSRQLYWTFVQLHCHGMYQATLHNGGKKKLRATESIILTGLAFQEVQASEELQN